MQNVVFILHYSQSKEDKLAPSPGFVPHCWRALPGGGGCREVQPLEGVQAARQGSGQLPRASSTQKGGGRAGWIRRARAGSGRARRAENLETCLDRASPPTTTALVADTCGVGMHGAPGVSGSTPEEAAPHGPERRPGGRLCRGSILLQCYVAQILFHGASCPQVPTFFSQAVQVRHKPNSSQQSKTNSIAKETAAPDLPAPSRAL